MSESHDPKFKRPAPGNRVQVNVDPNGPWVDVDHTRVDWSAVHRWRFALPEPPTTPAAPCKGCAHHDVPPWVKPCVDCITPAGRYTNFREPVMADDGEFDPKLKRPAFGDSVQVKIDRNGEWFYVDHTAVDWSSVYRWRLGPGPVRTTPAAPAPTGGGKLTGSHYYRVTVADPMAPDVPAYTAECADIIEALGMTFNEGECFKALWRLAAHRQGRVKSSGAGPQYDADKVAHYGARVAAQTKRGKA